MQAGNNGGAKLKNDEFDNLYQKNINRRETETVIRRSIPVQRDLTGKILPNQVAYYEEIEREVTFGATHHILDKDNFDSYIYPTNFEVREYQFNIVQKSLYQNTLCAIPTGMGKTFIASTVMLNFFRWSKNGKIIFTAPTRPLVAQQIKACLGITGIPHDQAAILLDKSRKNREDIWTQKRVFFTTPQVIENDLKRGVLNPKDIICLVFDEAHRATGSYAYTNVVKFIDRFNSSYRILALTATPGTDIASVQEVVNNLNISNIEIRTEESMDIIRYMKKRYKEKIEIGLTTEIEMIIEQLGIAVKPVLQQAVELGIYDECHPSQINSFVAMQKSQQIIANPTIAEGIKWRNFFILQLLNHVGQMLKRIKIYGIRSFYGYFRNKFSEFTTKYNMGKSTNKIAASFYYHPILKILMKNCDVYTSNSSFIGHDKLQKIINELSDFFLNSRLDSRVIIFTELRESALEIVKTIDNMGSSSIRPHIFIGQARGKENFDDEGFIRKNKPKGRKKADRLKRLEEDKQKQLSKAKQKEQEKVERSSRRTGSSEEAQISGMNQKQQKEVISKFKNGDYNVLVCTSIGEEGLDIGEVDMIICFDTTGSPIKNIQRMGRTGRKRDGKILLLFSGNESRKFEKAMEDYYDLQRLIGQNFVEYKKSDRILPSNITPECRKEFIHISAENNELNNMEDSDEVIRYATQCMLGKVPKSKKSKAKAAKEPKGKSKTFFMPDNVETGIVSAIALVNKKKSNSNESETVIKTECFPNLDDIEKDMLASLSSPVKPEVDDYKDGTFQKTDRFEEKITGSNLKDMLMSFSKRDEESKVTSFSSDGNYVNEPFGNISLGEKLDINDDFASTPIVKADMNIGQYDRSLIENNSRGGVLFKNAFEKEEGLLKKSEKVYFRDHYSIDNTVVIEPIPNFKRYNKSCLINHNPQVENILNLFKGINENKTQITIEMNRSRCIARGIEKGSIQLTGSDFSLANVMVAQKNNEADIVWDTSKTNKNSHENLNELLDSDSDF
ncbi:hypothetical protein Kpol_328p1 [Vanderwaltozyma polyspora DSM 70294]|uniref:ATP-dependent DNA helicase MPH1 n=1 Tax=Vanderwaltozyma polyspora (strain ATCC 22028 / DSM 70294 / BCRC 21397 / CBS 2163 / NBRC 10782 / NRRL Y-8283 / UCD 57-17) TaxID=436907 RepID=MPH1_VANPO|nr:uncharacterized protein Kpol_328p1 [Vanderwaltozyma polyspora DSM 70294]A7TSV4.1 RecName: Full=ATP-dependent DNA helicase MPH1; AltName: Full=FANCM-like protein 1 [Vanderwaltozyma polyspora DSM 70294]EDO14649.1 hypothetical protein Kpol_328p1 [Vanderwaltozyma polyspora DSM 70294]